MMSGQVFVGLHCCKASLSESAGCDPAANHPTEVADIAELDDHIVAEDCCEKKPNHIHDIRKPPVCGTLLP